MVEVKKYLLPPTPLVPNSPHPLLHYQGMLSSRTDRRPEKIFDLLTSNGWQTKWVFRYGPTQRAHYHSAAHECMAVLSGTATIRFGVADTDPDLDRNTNGSSQEAGGIKVEAKAGDVFVLPAGTAHKTFNTTPAEFALLTPSDGHDATEGDLRSSLACIELSGFVMLGAYPMDRCTWDFATGGENQGEYEKVWSVPKPDKDPIMGKSEQGLCGLWK